MIVLAAECGPSRTAGRVGGLRWGSVPRPGYETIRCSPLAGCRNNGAGFRGAVMAGVGAGLDEGVGGIPELALAATARARR